MTTKPIRRAMGITYYRNSGAQHGDNGQVIAVSFNHPQKGRRGYGELVTVHKSNARVGWWKFLTSLEDD